MHYNKNNVFAKILRNDLPYSEVYSDEYVLAFADLNPRAKVHVLVIPRGEYTDIVDFTENAPAKLQAGFWQGVRNTVDELEISDNFRLVANTGRMSGQSVMHFHVHIMSDEKFAKDF